MSTEAKHLRGIILLWQLWCQRQIELGLIDVENTPACFNRSANDLQRLVNESTLGKTCFYCSKSLTAKTVTDNHIRWFCNEVCMSSNDKAENKALRSKEHD